MKKFLVLIVTVFSLISCAQNEVIKTNRLEAEDAFLYCHPNNAEFEWSIQTTENLKASAGKAVEYIRKGDSIIRGIETNKDISIDFSLRVSFPLKWQSSDGPSPTSFVFDNIYELTLNNKKLSFNDVNEFKDDISENIYNYNYRIDFKASSNLIKGNNIIKLTKIIGNNEYASTGNVDYIDIISSASIKTFLPDVNPDISNKDGALILEKDTFIKNEEILVKAKPVNGVSNQVVALYQKNASLFSDKPLFKFNVNEHQDKFINILLYPFKDEVILGTGIYKIVLMDEITSISYYTIYIEVVEEHL